jgi:beta-phosphoglucomutase
MPMKDLTRARFAVIFDVDGVLIDSAETTYRVKRVALAKRGIDIDAVPDPHNEQHKGGSIKTLLRAVHESHGLKIDEQEFADEIVPAVFQELKSNHKANDRHLVALLNSLRNHSIPCAIASSARREGVQNKLSVLGIGRYFDVVIAAQDVSRHKPDPEAYVLAAQGLDIPTERCIVLEDSAAGVAAGKSAGCRVIGMTRYNEAKEALPGADLTIDRWDELSYDRLTHLVKDWGLE